MEAQAGVYAITNYKEKCQLCDRKVANCRLFYSPVIKKLDKGEVLTFLEQLELVEKQTVYYACYRCVESDDWRIRGYIPAEYELCEKKE